MRTHTLRRSPAWPWSYWRAPGTFSQAHDINPAGSIVGGFGPSGGEWDWALWDRGAMTNLGRFSEAMAINSKGQVVGYTVTDLEAERQREAFLWDKGVITDLGFGVATDINARGQIVGYAEQLEAFLWEDGVRTRLCSFGVATALNAAGQIVGECPYGRAVLWKRGRMIDLGTLGGSGSKAEDINDAGQNEDRYRQLGRTECHRNEPRQRFRVSMHLPEVVIASHRHCPSAPRTRPRDRLPPEE